MHCQRTDTGLTPTGLCTLHPLNLTRTHSDANLNLCSDPLVRLSTIHADHDASHIQLPQRLHNYDGSTPNTHHPHILTFSTALPFFRLIGVATYQPHKIQTSAGFSNSFIHLTTTHTTNDPHPPSKILNSRSSTRSNIAFDIKPQEGVAVTMYLILLLCALLLHILLLRFRGTPTFLPGLCHGPLLARP